LTFHYDADTDPDPTFHFKAVTDPETLFVIKVIRILLLTLTVMRIRKTGSIRIICMEEIAEGGKWRCRH
jgi:hypothetical protein